MSDATGSGVRRALGEPDCGWEILLTVGWGTIAYGIAAGVSAALAIIFLLIGFRGRRSDPLMASFGVVGLVTAVSTIVTLRLHTSSTLEQYVETFKLFGVVSLVGLIVVVALVAAWTDEIPRAALIAFGVATVFVGSLQLSLPNGLLAGEIQGLRDVELVGERFVVHEGSTSSWRPVLDLYLLCVVAVLLIALFRGYRRGRRRVSLVVTLGLIAGLAFSAYDSLVDEHLVDTPYLSPFGASIVVVAAAVFLADRLVRTDAQFRELATRLEETVIERTAALITANDQFQQQLGHQRRSSRNLALLAQAFEASNSLVDPAGPDVRDSLEQLIGVVGTTAGARSVQLEITDEVSSDVVVKRVSWEAADGLDGVIGDMPYHLTEQIRIAGRTIGKLVAGFASQVDTDSEQGLYLDLAAEHLSGLINRLELVRNLTDSAVEHERQRIAMELHDSVTQRMYSVAFLADALVNSIDQNPELFATARRVRELVLSSLAELRSMLLELRPTALDEADLTDLLGELGDTLASTSGVDVVVDAEQVPPLPGDVKVGLYRIAQEALSNACRHSGAETASVRLRHDLGVTTLTIADEGVGFLLSDQGKGQGLRNIASRSALHGLELDASSAPGSGTKLSVRWVHSESSSLPLEQGAEV